MTTQLTTQAVLDALGHGVLIFSSDGDLVQYNIMAGSILGADLNIIRDKGWSIAAEMLDMGLQPMDTRLDAVREQALASDRPIRFKIFRSGAYIPCWAAALNDADGHVYLLLTLDVPDWEVVTHVIDRFRNEMHDLIDSTVGHMKLINRSMESEDDEAAQKIARRIGGFTRLVEIHMTRGGRLVTMLDRLQDIRVNALREKIRRSIKAINLEDFLEDFLELLDEIALIDPETEPHDFRSRVQLKGEMNVKVDASEYYLRLTVEELVRNAIMYSLLGTPITIEVTPKPNTVQITVQDEGYGIRDKDSDRVFDPFKRARQPQIIAEFGYGLALYLCKSEVEAMRGQLWFTSEESVGTTFYVQLPVAHE